MGWKPFQALPNYLGGKRALAPTIFREIAQIYPPREWPDMTLLDPFAGACSLALFAKAQGMRVIAGDIAERSFIIQQALIANSMETLDDEDLAMLFAQRNGYDHFTEKHFVPGHFPADFARFLDLALANITDHPSEVKQALLKLILFKMMKAPRIQFSDTTISRATETQTLETLASHKVKMAERWYLRPPQVIVHQLAQLIQRAIFSNGHTNEAHLCDALDLIGQNAHQVEILYLDPPYPGVTGYETYYPLDCVLAGKMLPYRRSAWSGAQFARELSTLLDLAGEIPLWVLSYGSQGTTIEYLLHLVDQFRPASAIAIQHAHLQAIARPEVAQSNQEFIIIAEKEGPKCPLMTKNRPSLILKPH